MIDQLSKAISYAAKYHAGQVDKAGKPYILHPLHVMSTMKTEQEMIVAILHDVLEDTDASFINISATFGESIANSVQLLTRDKEDEYYGYIDRIINSSDMVAKKVKMADLVHNGDLTRLEEITKADFSRAWRYYGSWKKIQLSC